jgi:hypothetical protein
MRDRQRDAANAGVPDSFRSGQIDQVEERAEADGTPTPLART